MKKKKSPKKLRVAKETLVVLDPTNLEPVVGRAAEDCGESVRICSEEHTCVSCQITTV